MKIIDAQSGDFTRAGGKQVMEAFLKKYGNEITAVYGHNDDMAIGAIQAIEEAGMKPGEDIKIVSVDAVRGAFEAMIAGKLNATVECNPLLGPQFYEMALKAVCGETLPKWVPRRRASTCLTTPRKSCRRASTRPGTQVTSGITCPQSWSAQGRGAASCAASRQSKAARHPPQVEVAQWPNLTTPFSR